jgi:reactive intermediate/imine deaminase
MPELEPVMGEGRATTDFRYTPAIRVADLVLVSGQVGVGPDGEPVGDDFLTQVHQAFANLSEVLQAAGSSLSQVAKVTVYLTEQSQFDHVPALREQYFTPPYPADTTVVVRALARPGLLVEIEAIAVC